VISKTPTSLKNTFDQGIRWNTLGSITYEGLKVFHQIALLSVMDLALYGHIGVIFSLIFLTINISNFAADSTIPAFLDIFTESRMSFIRIFMPYLLLQVPLLLLGGTAACFIYQKSIFSSTITIPLLTILLIVLFEGLRMVLRVFLHSLFMNKITMFIELLLMFAYMGTIWGEILIIGSPITLSLIFIPYLITSIMAVLLFCIILIWYATNLPSLDFEEPQFLWQRILKARFFNCSTKFSKQLFTGNFLVPLFAYKFGLASAGIFKFSSYLADGIRGVINVAIGFSSGALFAKLKSSDIASKKKAFYILSEKLNSIMYCTLIFLAFNYYAFWQNASGSIIVLSGFFLLILVLEHFCSVYEQVHIVEEKTSTIFLAKICEVAIACSAVLLHSSAILILINLVIARLIGFTFLATNAFKTWGIKPHFKVRPHLIATCMLLSLFILILQKLHFHGYNNFI
jgi:hypothetical protein